MEHSRLRESYISIRKSKNSKTRIVSIFPSLVQSTPEIIEIVNFAGKEYTRNYNHPKNPAYLGGRSKEGRRDLPGLEQHFHPRERNNRWNRRRTHSRRRWRRQPAPPPPPRTVSDENERRARNNVRSPLAWKVDDAPQPLLPSPRVRARPVQSRTPHEWVSWEGAIAASNHADRTRGQSSLEADYDGQHDGDDSPWCSRVLVTCQCQSGITPVWIGMPVRRAIFSLHAFSSMGK